MKHTDEGRTLEDLVNDTPEVQYIATMQVAGVFSEDNPIACAKSRGFISHQQAVDWIADEMGELQGTGDVTIVMHWGTPFSSVRSNVGPIWGWIAAM